MFRSAIVITLLAAGVAIAAAQPQNRGQREGLHKGQRMMQELNLTDQQEAQWQELHFALEKKQTTIRAKIDVARIELRELMAADKLDRTAIEKKTKEITDLQYQMKLAHIEHMFAVLNILTPEQQKEWKEHLSNPRGMMREWMMGEGMMREGMRQMMRSPRWGERAPRPYGNPEVAPEPDED